MKCIDKLTSWIMIICILLMTTMGIISASSWSAVGDESDPIYTPYVPLEYMRLTSGGNGESFVLRLNDVFQTLTNDNIVGLDHELLIDVDGYDNIGDSGSITIPCRISSIDTSNQNFIIKLSFDVSSFNNINSSDGLDIHIHTNDVLVSRDRTSAEWLPNIILKPGSGYDYPLFDMDFTASVNYFQSGIANSEFRIHSGITRSWTGLSSSGGRTNIFRLSNITNFIDNLAYTSADFYGGVTQDILLVSEYDVNIYTDYHTQNIELYMPYTPGRISYLSYTKGFDLGRYETQTVIQTVTRPDLDFSDEYVDFSGFLVKSIGSFMNFGFWGISIGGILIFCIAWKLVRMFINFFAGG